jgi:hypothetical protein
MDKLIAYIIKNTCVNDFTSIYHDEFIKARPIVPLSFNDIMNKTSLKNFYKNIINNEFNPKLLTINGRYELPYNIAITLMYYRDCLLASWFTIHVSLNNVFDKNKYEKVAQILSDKFADIIEFYYNEYNNYTDNLNN